MSRNITQQGSLETLRTFVENTRTESGYEELAKRNALNALNYLENWCLRTPNNQDNV